MLSLNSINQSINQSIRPTLISARSWVSSGSDMECVLSVLCFSVVALNCCSEIISSTDTNTCPVSVQPEWVQAGTEPIREALKCWEPVSTGQIPNYWCQSLEGNCMHWLDPGKITHWPQLTSEGHCRLSKLSDHLNNNNSLHAIHQLIEHTFPSSKSNWVE